MLAAFFTAYAAYWGGPAEAIAHIIKALQALFDTSGVVTG